MKLIKNNNNIVLIKILCIYYLSCFCKDKTNKMKILLNSSGKINILTPAYTLKLDIKFCCINIKTEKIDDLFFKRFEKVLADF